MGPVDNNPQNTKKYRDKVEEYELKQYNIDSPPVTTHLSVISEPSSYGPAASCISFPLSSMI